MKAMQLNEDFPASLKKKIQNCYNLCFDLTSLKDADEMLHYPEFNEESLRLEILFQFSLEQVTEVIV